MNELLKNILCHLDLLRRPGWSQQRRNIGLSFGSRIGLLENCACSNSSSNTPWTESDFCACMSRRWDPSSFALSTEWWWIKTPVLRGYDLSHNTGFLCEIPGLLASVTFCYRQRERAYASNQRTRTDDRIRTSNHGSVSHQDIFQVFSYYTFFFFFFFGGGGGGGVISPLY